MNLSTAHENQSHLFAEDNKNHSLHGSAELL